MLYYLSVCPSCCPPVHTCLGLCSDTIYDNSFIFFLRQINFTWNLFTVRFFDLLTFSLETKAFNSKCLSRQLLWNYKWQLFHIFRAYINLTWDLFIAGSFWLFVLWPWYYDLHIENTVQPIVWLRNYKCQLLHVLWAHQPNMGPVHCRIILIFWPLTLTLCPSPCKSCLDHSQKPYLATASYCFILIYAIMSCTIQAYETYSQIG